MNKLLVCSDSAAVTQRVVDGLKSAGAADVDVLDTALALKLPARLPRDTRYIFVCQPPAEKLIDLTPQVLPADTTENPYASELIRWYGVQSELLATYELHKARSLLTTHLAVTSNFDSLIHQINQRWRQNIKASNASPKKITDFPSQTEPMLGYLVQNLIKQTPQLRKMSVLIAAATEQEKTTFGEVQALEGYRSLKSEMAKLQAKQQALEKANLALTASRDEQASTAAERQKQVELLNQEKKQVTAQRDSIASEKANIGTQLKDSLEQAELILLQLHQVQEELENYFLKYKEAEQKHNGLQDRWRQMLKHYPDYTDYKWVEVSELENNGGAGKNTNLLWHFKGLESAGISRSSVVFETFVEAGVLGVRFKRSHSKSSDGDDQKEGDSLMRWPDVAKDLAEIECIPAGRGEIMALRASILRNLSSTDWELLQRVPKIVVQALTERPIEGVDAQVVLSAAKRLSDALSRLPQTPRHDSILLKKYQVNPDYEHLWFVFYNLRAGERHWPKFEIRLGASNIKPGKFSLHPKIEIPLIDGETKPFDSWFEESVDGFGGKWELRFDLSKNIYDDGVWTQLQPEERVLILALLNQLTQDTPPFMPSYIEMRRDWSDWQGVFYRCAQFLK